MSRFDIQRVARHLTHYTRWVLRAVQLAIFAVAGVLAFLLRFDLSVPPQYWPHLLAGLCVWITVKVFVFHSLGLDRGWWRYVSIRDVARLAVANLAGSALGFLALLWFAPSGFPRSVYFLDFLLCLGITAGARLTVRLAFEFSVSSLKPVILFLTSTTTYMLGTPA
jgi:FlaA1/EpsC-like NDP-sugar epimerase